MQTCANVATVAFAGLEARRIEVQVQLAPGTHGIVIVGLGDKAVSEARERVRAAFASIGLAIPAGRLVINLAPADMPKEGTHYDLPIALATMAAIGALPHDALDGVVCFGEVGLDGALAPAPGALPAAMAAHGMGAAFICPEACGAEAAWAGGEVIAAPSLLSLVNHFRGGAALKPPERGDLIAGASVPDLRDVRGQEQAKRALEIAAAGAHNILFVGPPGAGKSMLAQRLPGLLPPLSSEELLEVSMLHSVAGLLERGRLTRTRPFRAPHHSASMAALVGGGLRAKPGEISLAHQGVLFLDELPEFSQQALDALRQPLESGQVLIARANHHVTYPARILLAAAMNPCRCGGGSGAGVCRRGRCAIDYQARLSGPLLDRIDIQLDVPPVTAADLALPPPIEGTAEAAARVGRAREAQTAREAGLNATLALEDLERVAAPDAPGAALLAKAAESLALSARAYHRTLKVARTIADLDGSDAVRRIHVAEALSLKRQWAGAEQGAFAKVS
ncbi:MAG TPA: YifB family Mg chelatase-like AAA ATPase [Vitreimonas sp.]|uniref:YifB family Mg chelatase-like AAA ATPase n=1 Tax=Vitreimonas sp. TaxID=3069702 RepID=UPI002D2BCA4D|nr:YifB family Mg chelatase-like AAA ATPase [Vitreimonas sp.]HYD89624.1 YifB family Mg chelatase-like AAA ATPase [Vitreimonas sp.]